jgi:hypothetical protein
VVEHPFGRLEIVDGMVRFDPALSITMRAGNVDNLALVIEGISQAAFTIAIRAAHSISF